MRRSGWESAEPGGLGGEKHVAFSESIRDAARRNRKDSISDALLARDYILRTAYYLLLTYLVLDTHYLLLTTYYLPLTTYDLLLRHLG